MIICLIFGFSVFIWRLTSLKSERPIESFLSREASFLVNNFLLLGVTFATLWGVIFPVLAEFAQGKEISVAAPYFNTVNGPMLLTVLFVMGIGPLLPWRRTARRSLIRHVAIPTLAGLAVAVGLDCGRHLQRHRHNRVRGDHIQRRYGHRGVVPGREEPPSRG